MTCAAHLPAPSNERTMQRMSGSTSPRELVDADRPPPGAAPSLAVAALRLPSVAIELRRRRELLGITQTEAAKRSGISRTVISEIEAGSRVPSVRTYEKLRAGLGLVAPASVLLPRRPPADLHETVMSRLAACVVMGRSVLLSDLALATETSIPAVREGLLAITPRLAAVGLAAADDGVRVEVAPLRSTEQAVAAITPTEEVGV